MTNKPIILNLPQTKFKSAIAPDRDFIIRRAHLNDVAQMMPLLNDYARQAEILPRLEDDVYRSIREWVVADAGPGQLIGMGSLLIMGPDLAEIRSLVVAPAWHGRGVGRSVVDALVMDAEILELPTLFALTRQPGFFLKLGFSLTKKERLPQKIMRDCIFCPKFHACDEIAVVKQLTINK